MTRIAALAVVLLLSTSVSAAEVVWLDGRRETVNRVVVKGDAVLVSFEKGMRKVSRRRLVKATGDDGNPIVLNRALLETPPSEMTKAALAQLPGAGPEQLPRVQEQVADSMSRAVMGDLVELAKSKRAEVRARAAITLLLMGLDEPIEAGLKVALNDADKTVRLRVASALFQVRGALKPDDIVKGLEDRESATKAAYALVLGDLGDKRAIPVLRTAGLKNGDHHVRESAAETLAALGDDSGVAVLVGMLSRTKHPAGASLPAQLFLEEKIRVCGYLGQLHAREAVPALKKAARSKQPELAAAATKALADIAAP